MHKYSKAIVFVGCVETGYFCAQRLIKNGIAPAAIVSIDEKTATRNHVSGYRNLFDLEVECEKYCPKTYSLKDPQDISFFTEHRFDLLVILGWQRLIPKEIIDTLSICGLTIHGSAEGLPKGRGRSPMNWAIVEGHSKFHLSLLTMNADADAGKILGTVVFDILPCDNIRTLYYKNAIAASELLVSHIPRIIHYGIHGVDQDDSTATYYPKRSPEDGKIEWTDPAYKIERLVKATTRPYPGAFTYRKNSKVFIWQAQLFDKNLRGNEMPGTVAAVFPDGAFIVNTGDGYLLVLDYEGMIPNEGDLLK